MGGEMPDAQMHADIRRAQGRLEKVEAERDGWECRFKEMVVTHETANKLSDRTIKKMQTDIDTGHVRVADLRKEYDRVNTLLVELARRAARGRCGVHDEPLVLVWRCEEPANTNRAPRPVCPDCLEERVEELEAGIRAEVAAIPGHVVVREEGGDEDVLASLAVSVGKLKAGTP